MYRITPVLNGPESTDLRREFFEALTRHEAGEGPLPHDLAKRIPLRLDGSKWTLVATLDAAPLRLSDEWEWERLGRRLTDAVSLARHWCPLPHVWRESHAMQTMDGPHMRYVRLFVRAHHRDDTRILMARLGMREVVHTMQLPARPKTRGKLSLVPSPSEVADTHIERVRAERQMFLELMGEAGARNTTRAAAQRGVTTPLRLVAGGR
jgi:hypothetical protein